MHANDGAFPPTGLSANSAQHLGWRHAADLHITGDPDSHGLATSRPPLRLLREQSGVIYEPQCFVAGVQVVTAVIGDSGGSGERKLLRPYEVLASDLGGVHP